MIAAHVLRKLALAVLLALSAWVLTAGTASAHGAHTGVDTRIASVAATSLSAYQHEDLAALETERADGDEAFIDRGESSCPTGTPANHTGNCCTIACHAAMAAPAIDPWVGPEASSSLLVALSDMLEGRCGDRSERPPRLG